MTPRSASLFPSPSRAQHRTHARQAHWDEDCRSKREQIEVAEKESAWRG